MIYLGTSPCEPQVEAALNRRDMGLMCQPQSNLPRVGWLWAADNGCFASSWREDRWSSWLTKPHPRSGCLFAVVPDVVGDAEATLERFDLYVARVRAARFPIAYAAQDGSEHLPPPWDELDCLFVGGTTDWKISAEARELAVEARQRGKWVHLGRVNSAKRFHAWSALADSCDGTLLAHGPATNISRVLAWNARFKHHEQLPMGAA